MVNGHCSGKFRFLVRFLVLWLIVGNAVYADRGDYEPDFGVADILEAARPVIDPAARRQAAEAARVFLETRRGAGVRRVRELSLPVRVERPDGTVKEVADVDAAGNPVYFLTHNDMAAISTAADQLHREPYGLSGAGLIIGMWDGGAGRPTHREFTDGRMVIQDGAAPIDHATHVGGTLAAAGVTARAKGMAFAATIDSYDWNNDKAEMIERGAAGPDDPEEIYISNHSYGFITGWYRTGGSSPAYIWYGSGTTADSIDPRFGQYNTAARDSDAIAYNAPYYLMFRSAGNDRIDNPTAGQNVQLSPSSTATTVYDPAVHPAGDGVYRGGYDTISFDAVAKNVITIGSVADAVTSGIRDLDKAVVSNFSSWGPTDDGRIKPDLVANGELLYSSRGSGDSSYGSLSGTSMSTPNATGTAALLIEEYRQLFAGGNMRSCMLKGLLIHTADDLGNPGPDYRYGWGLVNGRKAVELIRDQAAQPQKKRMLESRLTTGTTQLTYNFVWDGSNPIRATLCWTDPAGAATTSADLRSPRLRNNLDLRIIGPDNQLFYPYVMPFVGTWTVESMQEPATTGINNTDNVEQVFIASPPAAGVYRLEITYQGTLTNNEQIFSLLLDGASGEEPPPPLSLQSVSPASAYAGGTVRLEVRGTALETVTDLRLSRDNGAAIIGAGLHLSGDRLYGDLDLTGAASGTWNLQAANETETAVLEDAFTVIGSLWSENFDATVSGWSSVVLENHTGNQWALTTERAHTAPASYFAPGLDTRTTTALESPAISIPENGVDLQLRFHHRFELANQRHGGRLEFQVDNGPWTGIDSSSSAAVFASNGYNGTIKDIGPPGNRSFFDNQAAWTGSSGGFIETIVNLVETEKFAGRNIRFRWILATNNNHLSHGWYVDSIVLLGGGNLTDQPPWIVNPITVLGAEAVEENEETVFIVRDSSAELIVEAADEGGAESLIYSWSAGGPETVFFLPDNSSEAAATTAWFESVGTYTITVVITNESGLTVIDSTSVRVLAAPASLQLNPASVVLRVGDTNQFSATLLDQFNDPLEEQPESFTWSAGGGGEIDNNGLFLAVEIGENYIVSATVTDLNGTGSSWLESATGGEEITGGLSDFAQVTVLPGIATLMLADLEQFYDGLPKAVSLATDPEDLAVLVTYDGVETPPFAVGSYTIEAVSIDPNYEGTADGILVIIYDRKEFDQWITQFGLEGEEAEPGADPDGSGMTNWLKWRFNFDPTDPAERLRVDFTMTDQAAQLIINRVINEGVFSVQGIADLREDGWQTLTEITPEAAADDYLVEMPPIIDSRFFLRVLFQLNTP